MVEEGDFYKKRLGNLLNRDKIKLWEPPYTNDDGSSGQISKVCIPSISYSHFSPLTLSQTSNFRLFQAERVCR